MNQRLSRWGCAVFSGLWLTAGCAGVPLHEFNEVAGTLQEATLHIERLNTDLDQCRSESIRTQEVLDVCLEEDAERERQLTTLQTAYKRLEVQLSQCEAEGGALQHSAATEQTLRSRYEDQLRAQGEQIAELLQRGKEQEAAIATHAAENEQLRRHAQDTERRARVVHEYVQATWAPWATQALAEQQVPGAHVEVLDDTSVRFQFLADDLFAPGTAAVTRTAGRHLSVVAEIVKQWPGRVEVRGYSDDLNPGQLMREQFPSNWELSATRAASVVRVLTQGYGLPAEQVVAVGMGVRDPIASNATVEGRSKNRRVEIWCLDAAVSSQPDTLAIPTAAGPDTASAAEAQEGSGPGEKPQPAQDRTGQDQ